MRRQGQRRRGLRWLVALPLLALTLAGTPTIAAPEETRSDRRVAAKAGARSEPAVAVHPRDPRVVVIAALAFRVASPLYGGYDPLVTTWTSLDGGRTFPIQAQLPRPAGSVSTVDPSLAFGRNGTLYAGFLSSGGTNTGMWVARSTDLGRTWNEPVRTSANPRTASECRGADKGYVTVGPGPRGRGEVVYMAWHDHVRDPTCRQYRGVEVRLARSLDGARSFSAPVRVSGRQQSGSPLPKVSADGTLYVAHYEVGDTGRCDPSSYSIDTVVARSTDGGRTFAATTAFDEVCGVGLAPGARGALYLVHSMPAFDLDPQSGALAVAVASSGPPGQQVLVRSSADGRRWGPLSTVGDSTDEHQMPWLAFAPTGGTLALLYLRHDSAGLYAPELRTSRDGGSSWSSPTQVASVRSFGNDPHNMSRTVWSLGHYLGMDIGRDGMAHAAWPDVRDATYRHEDVWTRAVRVAPGG